MKKVLIAAGMLAIGATSAVAQGVYVQIPFPGAPEYRREYHPYARRHHRICQEKAWRLRDYERRTTLDGRVSKDERRNIEALRRDLHRTCGGYRWRD